MRRRVRLTEDFFDCLDRALPASRSGGLPSRRDFEVTDLLALVEVFATEWDDIPPLIAGRPDYRQWIGPGTVVLAIVAQGQLARDGAVELVSLGIEPWPDAVDDALED